MVVTPLQVADRLVVDPERLREILPGETPLGTQDGQAVVGRRPGRPVLAFPQHRVGQRTGEEVGSVGPCFRLSLPQESLEEESRIASLLLDFFRSPEGAEGMAMLASRGPQTPRQIYIFPGSQPRVREAVDGLVRKYGGSPCEPPAADETMFLVGSTAVWKQLPRAKGPRQRSGRSEEARN